MIRHGKVIGITVYYDRGRALADLGLIPGADSPCSLCAPPRQVSLGPVAGTLAHMESDPTNTEAKDAALRQLKTASKEILTALVDKLGDDAREAGATEQEIWDAITS
jgi:hypothetical protein